MDRYQEQGRASYARGDFRKALECFDRAIGRQASIDLLDNRAACHERLGDLQAALKDAKKTIQLQRADATGYLRAGRVLVQMEKKSVAMELYTHGLKSIKHIGRGYEMLRKAHGELATQLSPPKSVDPLTVLPRELAESILEYCTFKQRMNACLVSKGWAQFVRSLPGLWQHLDLSGANRRVKSAFISRAINTARSLMTAATLNLLFDPEKALAALLKHCPIRELTLLGTSLQSEDLAFFLQSSKSVRSLRLCQGTIIASGALCQILHECYERLELLECTLSSGSIHHLKIERVCERLKALHLTINWDSGRLSEWNDTIFWHHFPNLESLTFHSADKVHVTPWRLDVHELAVLKKLDIRLPILTISLLKWPPSLETLALASTRSRLDGDFWSLTGFDTKYIRLPNLRELCVDVPCTSLADISGLLELPLPREEDVLQGDPERTLSKLSTLNIHSAEVTPPALDTFLSHPRLSDIRTLALRQSEGCDDSCMQIITCRLPKITHLDVSGSAVTGIGAKEVVTQRQPKKILMNDCRFVGSDAVEWARSQGVTVEHRMTGTTSGGRKVRY